MYLQMLVPQKIRDDWREFMYRKMSLGSDLMRVGFEVFI